MNRIENTKAGFTLVDTLIALTLISVVLLGLFTYLGGVTSVNKRVSDRGLVTESTKRVAEEISANTFRLRTEMVKHFTDKGFDENSNYVETILKLNVDDNVITIIVPKLGNSVIVKADKGGVVSEIFIWKEFRGE